MDLIDHIEVYSLQGPEQKKPFWVSHFIVPNANELLNQSLTSFKNSNKDDFYDILGVNPLPDEEQAKSMHPAIDTAIKKCSEVIKNHSIF